LDHLFHALLLQHAGVGSKIIVETFTHSMVSERITRALANAGLNIIVHAK
jgi:hypothetical protein